ncbi:MAG TPA: hypothetical protein VK498_07475 [Ferruginibacter sp.]|nr:hypothetical protein [Ferruginibacter sp.]
MEKHQSDFPNINFSQITNRNFEQCRSGCERISVSENDFVCNLMINSFENRPEDRVFMPSWVYHIYNEGDFIMIGPDIPLLNKLRDREPLTTSNKYYSDVGPLHPELTFKFFNISQKSIQIKGIKLDVSESAANNFPLLIIAGEQEYLTLPLFNIGWDSVYNCSLNYNIVKTEKEINFKNLAFKKSIGNFLNSSPETRLAKDFSKFGLDSTIISDPGTATYANMDELHKIHDMHSGKDVFVNKKIIKKALGSFKDNVAYVYGLINYSGNNIEDILVSDTSKFIYKFVFLHPMGGPQPPSPNYWKDFFDMGKKNYSLYYPISRWVGPRQADSCEIKIALPKSSKHIFNIHVFYENGRVLTFRNVFLNYFKPRFDALYDVELMMRPD